MMFVVLKCNSAGAQWSASRRMLWFITLSVYASSSAETSSVAWMITCHIRVFSLTLSALMKDASRWIEEMLMSAVELDLQHAGIDVVEPFRLVRMVLEIELGDEGLVAADDHHDQQVGDHHHVDEAQHDDRDLVAGEIGRPGRAPPGS